MNTKYDYLIVGAGLFGGVFAHEAASRGKSCLVIDKREHTGGNLYCETMEGIRVHKYGAHIFHTCNPDIWHYMNRFTGFNNYINSPVAVYGDEVYNLPFNMNTFSKMWGITTPAQAREIIARQVAKSGVDEPKNLEEQALKLVGEDIYYKLIKDYTEKQWGRPCRDLPASIINRLPLRFTYDNNYFNDRFQGIPTEGYNAVISALLAKAEVLTGTDFKVFNKLHPDVASRIIYTGTIDSFFDFCYGPLEYRTLRFESEVVDCENYQGVAVVNYTKNDVPYTRIIEHKHFEFGRQEKSVITREYPAEWTDGAEPYYPICDERNIALYARYAQLAAERDDVFFGGRLGGYKYLDMDKTVEAALLLTARLL